MLRTKKLLQLLPYVLIVLLSSLSFAYSKKHHQSHQVGGYSHIDTDDDQVIRAAELVVNNLRHGEGGGDIGNYSFDFPSDLGGVLDVKVLNASKQVVAGMNYKIAIGIYASHNCIGGLKANVFRDLGGTFSVSSYGKEITCEDIETFLNKDSEEDEE